MSTPVLFALAAALLCALTLAALLWPLRVHFAQASRGALVALMLSLALLPLAAVLLYLLLGAPAALPAQSAPEAARAQGQQIEAMVSRLAKRLEQNPDDRKGWAMLARSLRVLGRLEESLKAFAHALEQDGKVISRDADALCEYAQTLAIVNQDSFKGKPAALVARALSMDAQNPQALYYSGVVAFERRDFAGALKHWGQLRRTLAEGSEGAGVLDEAITKAQSALSQRP